MLILGQRSHYLVVLLCTTNNSRDKLDKSKVMLRDVPNILIYIRYLINAYYILIWNIILI